MKPVVIFTLEDVVNSNNQPQLHPEAKKAFLPLFEAIFHEIKHIILVGVQNLEPLLVKMAKIALVLASKLSFRLSQILSKVYKIAQNYTKAHGPGFLRFVEERKWGLALLAITIGAFAQAVSPIVKIEAKYFWSKTKAEVNSKLVAAKPIMAAPKENGLPEPLPASPEPNPLVAPDGSIIEPKNTDFTIIIPKLGINTGVIAGVNPGNEKEYLGALKNGVAHAVTSFYPSQNGSVYLFSHSTNYQWFVKDLNAVFYLIKNLEPKDQVVVIFKNQRFTYEVREQKVVPPSDASYIYGTPGKRELILQTCWPPGTVFNRLLIFADLVEVKDL